MVTVIHFRPEFARAVVIEDTQHTSRRQASHARKGCDHTVAHDLALTHALAHALILEDVIGRKKGENDTAEEIPLAYLRVGTTEATAPNPTYATSPRH